jgi:hypothetical protein
MKDDTASARMKARWADPDWREARLAAVAESRARYDAFVQRSIDTRVAARAAAEKKLAERRAKRKKKV